MSRPVIATERAGESSPEPGPSSVIERADELAVGIDENTGRFEERFARSSATAEQEPPGSARATLQTTFPPGA